MTGNVGGPLTPQQAAAYREEYREGADLFQRALVQYSEADEMHKQAAIEKVLNQALTVMNQAAAQLKSPALTSVNQQIAQDYQAYQSSHSPAAIQKLNHDLEKAKDLSE